MLDIELIRREPEKVKDGVSKKGIDPKLVDDFLVLDGRWRELVSQVDGLRAQLNKLSKEKKIEEARAVKARLKDLESQLSEIEPKRHSALLMVPNLPDPDWPIGKNESQNKVIREVGEKPKFAFKPKDYLTLAENLNIIDIKRAAKVSGTRFGYLLKEAALLEFALVKFAIDKLMKRDFIPVVPPVLINEKSMRGMGYLERGRDETYYLPEDKLYLIGTSEQAIGPMHQDEIFEEKDLPRRYVGFSTCFRREAGSYGKDTRGILRVHQFDKLEMFSITAPEKSTEEHRLLLGLEEKLMQDLKLPYRVVQICTGDLGDPAAAKYDIEVWLPGQNSGQGEYRETHSASNTTDYQSRRLNIKLRTQNSELRTEYVHMLNATVFAIGRMIIAILENCQTKEGNVLVPKVLQKYAGIKKIKR